MVGQEAVSRTWKCGSILVLSQLVWFRVIYVRQQLLPQTGLYNLLDPSEVRTPFPLSTPQTRCGLLSELESLGAAQSHSLACLIFTRIR